MAKRIGKYSIVSVEALAMAQRIIFDVLIEVLEEEECMDLIEKPSSAEVPQL